MDGRWLGLGEDKPGVDGRFAELKSTVDRSPLPLRRAVAGKVPQPPARQATKRISTVSEFVILGKAPEAPTAEAVYIASRLARASSDLHRLNSQWDRPSPSTVAAFGWAPLKAGNRSSRRRA
jgi:hypothetical protein